MTSLVCRYCSCRLCTCYVIDLQLWWSPLGFDSCVVLSCVLPTVIKIITKAFSLCFLPIIWHSPHSNGEVTKNAVFHTTGRVWLVFEMQNGISFSNFWQINFFLQYFRSFKNKTPRFHYLCFMRACSAPKKTICSYSITIWKTTRGEKWASDSFWRGPPSSSRSITWSCWSAGIYCIGIHYNKRQK